MLIGAFCECSVFDYIHPYISQCIFMNALVFSGSLAFKFGLWHRVLIINGTIALILYILEMHKIQFDWFVYILIITTFVAVTFSIYEKAK